MGYQKKNLLGFRFSFCCYGIIGFSTACKVHDVSIEEHFFLDVLVCYGLPVS